MEASCERICHSYLPSSLHLRNAGSTRKIELAGPWLSVLCYLLYGKLAELCYIVSRLKIDSLGRFSNSRVPRPDTKRLKGSAALCSRTHVYCLRFGMFHSSVFQDYDTGLCGPLWGRRYYRVRKLATKCRTHCCI